jgi:hypothetical protein
VQIVFNDLFNQKTPRALAAFVATRSADQRNESHASESKASQQNEGTRDSSAFTALLSKNTLNVFRKGERRPVGDVLLTGATGYMGMHILNELLSNYDGHILCPLRSKAGDDPMHRLKTLFFYYFGKTEAFRRIDERVTVFAAEVTQPNALDGIEAHGLTVVCCVANVKHFSAGNDIELVNIESVRHLITFCLRTSSRLIHVSTNSIAGLSIDGKPGPEVKDQAYHINARCQIKY